MKREYRESLLCSSEVSRDRSTGPSLKDREGDEYRGSPTSTVSSSTNSTCTNFGAIGIKVVLVELLCSKISTI